MTHMYLIAEYCNAQFYTGWHLYLRDNNNRQQRNADGEWGWIRGFGRRDSNGPVRKFLASLGIQIRGDGTCDNDGIAEFAKRFSLGRQRIGGKPRGCLEVTVGEWGEIELAAAEAT